MKTAILLFVATALNAAAELPKDLLNQFAQPPPSSRPWVFWIWMNGNITSNGITADLEAMQRAGIGGVTIMEVDYDTPKGLVDFGSQVWRDLFVHTCSEAHRLGLSVRMNNDAGYCGSGGPWITPELSMQKLAWTEQVVSSVADLAVPLPQPEVLENFYRDVAVLAFPIPPTEMVAMADFNPQVAANLSQNGLSVTSLTDGNTNTAVNLPQPRPHEPSFVQVSFERPYTARQLVLTMPLSGDQIVHGFLQSSDDGQNYRTIRDFSVIPSTQVFNFPAVTARHFRILFTRPNPDLDQFVISEIELSPRLRIENIEAKALFTRKNAYPGPSEFPGRARYAEPVPELPIKLDQILNLTTNLDPSGKLNWTPPPGHWTVLRIGHTSTGKRNHPSPEAGLGLECDKLSKPAAEAAFYGLMGKLLKDAKPFVGRSFLSTHIDSWELGSQNWTADFPSQFLQRRHYDPVLMLPVITGRIVQSLEISERFLWDFRETVSEMLAENYAGHFRTLAHKHGLTLSIEGYDAPSDDLTYGGQADEPMAEFWSWPAFEMTYTCTEMVSAGHVYGRPIISAEAFTAVGAERWLGHPYSIKIFGDWAMCEGINRLVIHRYAMQPWTEPARFPGMAFGPFGVRFERTQTWWSQSRPWHEYLARSQYLLRQGVPAVDFCYLAPQISPRRWRSPNPDPVKDGYTFDACPADVALNRMEVKHGRLVVPGGLSYALLAIQPTETMTPQLLSRLRDLVRAGATIVGSPPLKSPSLAGFPECDSHVQRLVNEVWGKTNGKTPTEHSFGKGRVIWSSSPQEVLARIGLPPDFAATSASGAVSFNFNHRTLPQADIYFVANARLETAQALCSFRVRDTQPYLLWPESGKVEQMAVYESGTTTRLPLRLGPAESVFVVFSKRATSDADAIATVTHAGRTILATRVEPLEAAPALADGSNSFTIAFWARPRAATSLPQEAVFGKTNYFNPRNDVLFPLLGHYRHGSPEHAGVGISVGTNGVWVIENSANYWGSPLVLPAALTNWTHFALVYENARPTLYLDGRLAREGIQSPFVVHCSVGLTQRRGSAPFVGGLGDLFHVHRAMNAAEVAELVRSMPLPESLPLLPTITLQPAGSGSWQAELWAPGEFVAETRSGREWRFGSFSLPDPIPVRGPWELCFPEGWGAPARVTLDHLTSWSEHPDPGVRHFSGAADYFNTFELPPSWLLPDRRVYLDLGQVAVMAEVEVNGHPVGTLWKSPFCLEITSAAKPGKNQLKIKVVNLWINRMIGDESLPEDSERNPNGSLKQWPKWLLAGEPSPSGRFTFTTYRHWRKGASLQSSGLLGPITLVPTTRVWLGK